MTALMGDRESSTVGVMKGIHADDWSTLLNVYHARKLAIERRGSESYAKFLNDLYNRNRRSSHFVALEKFLCTTHNYASS